MNNEWRGLGDECQTCGHGIRLDSEFTVETVVDRETLTDELGEYSIVTEWALVPIGRCSDPECVEHWRGRDSLEDSVTVTEGRG